MQISPIILNPSENLIFSFSSSSFFLFKNFSIFGLLSSQFKNEKESFWVLFIFKLVLDKLFSFITDILTEDVLCSIVVDSIVISSSSSSYLFLPEFTNNFCLFNIIGILLFNALWYSFKFENSTNPYPFDLFVILSFITVAFKIEEHFSLK